MIHSITTKLPYSKLKLPISPSILKKSSILTAVRHNCFESFAKKMLENLIGYRAMSPKELSEAKILHQKLWVVHASIRNDAQADEHYEMAYSLQLLDHPKNFDVQQRYVKILEKENISRKEMMELLELYQLGLSKSKPSFFTPELTKKVKECQTFLSSSQELFPNPFTPYEWKQRKKEES